MRAVGERWLGLAGIAFVILFLTGFTVIGNPGDIGEEVLAFYDENAARAIVAFLLFMLSGLAYVVFVAALRGVLARGEVEPRVWTGLGFGAGLVSAALMIVGAAPVAALGDVAGEAGEGTAGAFDLVNSLSYPLLTGGIASSALLALALGVVALRTPVLPRWVGWVSIVAAPFILVAFMFIPIFIFLLWVAIVSVALFLQSAPARAVAPDPT